MPRIEIELTSSRPDGTWTWRAAGARQPKGSLDGALLYPGAKVGDVVRADSEMGLEGISVTAVVAPKTKRSAPDRLALLGSGRDEPGVTGDGVAAARRGEKVRDRTERRPGRDRGATGSRGAGQERTPGAGPGRQRPAERDRGAARPSERSPRPGGTGDRARPERPGRPGGAERGTPRDAGRDRPARPQRESRPSRPRPRRLQPGRKHRDAATAELPPEQRPIAEQVLRGGMQAVRQAVVDQNARARAAGEPEVRADALIAMAEGMVTTLRAAEWRDRAEAAVADIDVISLRDLRAVVAGSDAAGRDDESRALVAQLREGLERRSAIEREAWLKEVRGCLSDGRLVRALRVSSRPPEPTAKIPQDLATEMSEATGNALAPDVAAERWLALLEAAMSSPVRAVVRPKGLPTEPNSQLRKAVMLASPRMPGLRELIGASPGDPRARLPVPPPPTPAPAPTAAPVEPSGDDGDDAVLVEELG